MTPFVCLRRARPALPFLFPALALCLFVLASPGLSRAADAPAPDVTSPENPGAPLGFSPNGEWECYGEPAGMQVDMTAGKVIIREEDHTETFVARADSLGSLFLRLTLYDEQGFSIPVTLCSLDQDAMAAMFGESELMVFFRKGTPVPQASKTPPSGSFSLVYGESSSLTLDFTRKVAIKNGGMEAPLNARPAAPPFEPGSLLVTLEGTEAGVAVQMGENMLLVFEADDPSFPVLAFGRAGRQGILP